MRLQAKLPKQFWAEEINVGCFVVDKTPKKLGEKST